MPIVQTFKSSIFSTTSATSYLTSPTWAADPGDLCIAWIASELAAAPDDPTGVTGHGFSYTKIALPSATVGATHILSLWACSMPAGGGTGGVQATYATSRPGCAIIEVQCTGVDVTGGLASAFVQKKSTNGTGTGGTATNLLDAVSNAANMANAFWVHLAAEVTTPAGGNWSEIADGNHASPATGAECQVTPSTFDRTPAASWATNVAWRVAAIELKATLAGGGTLKTINGLASASLKTVLGLAKASVKTVNGLTP
jgi:hypothetical protein